MKQFFQYVGAIAVAGMCLLGVERPAQADQLLDCEMKGRWVEANEDWIFSAAYVSKAGPDTFTGIFANPKAQATAKVTGNVAAGAWTILFNYTDAGHAGWVKRLTGQGAMDPKTHILTIKGNFTLTKSGTQTGQGTFTLIGTCKPK
ncbi:Hypothetical protein A7982_08088 [Minicystis rosea]|nr:Hypothetical protein A7982_08088 [Minicystis rosea]